MKLEPEFGHFIHKTKPTHYNKATPRLKWSWSQNLVILYTRQSLHTTTQLLQGSSEAGAKICSYYTLDKAYTLQHSYYKAPLKVEPKFGHFIHRIKPTHYNTATPRLKWSWSQNLVILYTRQSLHTTTKLLQVSSEAGAKIWSFYTQDKAYTLQHSYSMALVKLEPKFGHFIHKTKPTHYNTATPRLKWSWSQNLVILYTRQSLHTTTQLLQGSSEAGARIWSFYTQDKAYTLQHSYSKALVKLEPEFGHFIHKTKLTHYNTATPRLKWSWSQNLVILYTRQSLHTTTQLLQGSSEAGAKICSYCTQDKAYTLQHSYYKAPLKVEPKFGHFIHRIKPTHYNTATPRL